MKILGSDVAIIYSLSIPTGSPSHDLPIPQQDTVEDAPKGAEQMIRDEEPVQSLSSNHQGSFWNSLGSIASSVQSTVSVICSSSN